MEEMSGSKFDEVNMAGAYFNEVDLSGSRFRGVNLADVKITDSWLFNTDISGVVVGLKVNGVDVTAYVENELNQRHPERLLLAPFDPDGCRTAWQTIEEFASTTLERARKAPDATLDESVEGEWSFLQTLRHLVFATDRWITGPVLGRADHWHRLGMPNPPYGAQARAAFDLDAQPSFDEVLAARRERMDLVAALVKGINADDLNRQVASPNGGMTGVVNCLHVVFREEWWHNQYANRDLTTLGA